MGFASTICFPVVAIVGEEVGDFAEDFKRDSVVERHDGDVDDGMMSDGNRRRGDVVCGRIFCIWNMVWQLVAAEYHMAVGFCFFVFPFSRMQDRR